MNIKGLTIQDIMGMSWEELNKLNSVDLRKITSRLVSASNKRIRGLMKAPSKQVMFSRGKEKVLSMGRQFSIKGKDVNAVKQEFKLMKQFLNMKTSTVKGSKAFTKDIRERTGTATMNESKKWTNSTWEKYWKVYRRFEENHKGSMKGQSEQIQKMITELMNSSDRRRSTDYFQRLVEDEYSAIYEQEQESEEDIADIFDLGDNGF